MPEPFQADALSDKRRQMLRIGPHDIGAGCRVFIIAEIGVNHEGNADVCAQMIKAAAEAGADSVKLQIVDPDESYAEGTESYRIFSSAVLAPEAVASLFDYARRLDISPFATSGDIATLRWVDRLNPVAHKISSGLMTHLPLIECAAKTSRPVLISTGMGDPPRIDEAVMAAQAAGAVGIGLFQCTSIYPAPPEALNLAAIDWLAERYRLPVGFSDHAEGDDAAFLSVAAGAAMLEKHFTLDVRRPGFDHVISLDASGFGAMVRRVRQAETVMGQREKRLGPLEQAAAARNRRFLVIRRRMAAGALLAADDIAFLRLAEGAPRGLEPRDLAAVVGRRLARSLEPLDPIGQSDLEPQ